MSATNNNWDARREHAIREGWPSAHGRKEPKSAEDKRRAKLEASRRARLAARFARCPLGAACRRCTHITHCTYNAN